MNFPIFESGGDFGVDFQIPREKSIPNNQKPSKINQNLPTIIKNHFKINQKSPKIICNGGRRTYEGNLAGLPHGRRARAPRSSEEASSYVLSRAGETRDAESYVFSRAREAPGDLRKPMYT